MKTKVNKQVQKAGPAIVGTAVLLGATGLASRVLGLIRDRLLAGVFGAGVELDVYYAAFRIPDLVFTFLVLGALSAGFIPFFTKRYQSKIGAKAAWAFTNNTLNIMGVSLLVLSAIGIVFTPQIIGLVAPGFDSDSLELAVEVSRIMYASTILLGLSSVFGGVLQGLKRFTLYAIAPLLYNLGIIFGAIAADVHNGGIRFVAWGVVAGAFMHFLLQLVGARKAGWRWRAEFRLKDKDTRKLIGLMGPRVIGLGLSQINLIVMTAIASYLAAGSIAVFSFANNIQYVPIGIVGISFAIAAFPTLSEYANKNRTKAMRNAVSLTARNILFLIVPLSVVFLLLRAQIVRVVLGAGVFGWNETIITAHVLAFFVLSLFAQALNPLLVRVYFAYKNTLTPAIVALITAAVNIALAIYWSPQMGVAGIALAFSVANILQVVLLWTLVHRKLGTLNESRVLSSLLTIVISAMLCGLMIQAMKSIYEQFIPLTTFFAVLGQGVVAGGLGLLVYAISAWTWKSPEFYAFVCSAKKRLPKKWRLLESADEALDATNI